LYTELGLQSNIKVQTSSHTASLRKYTRQGVFSFQGGGQGAAFLQKNVARIEKLLSQIMSLRNNVAKRYTVHVMKDIPVRQLILTYYK